MIGILHCHLVQVGWSGNSYLQYSAIVVVRLVCSMRSRGIHTHTHTHTQKHPCACDTDTPLRLRDAVTPPMRARAHTHTHTHTHTHKHTHTHIHNPHRTHWARTVSLKLSGRSLALRRCEFAKLLRLASLSARLASLSASHSVSGSESESARLAGLRAIVG